MGKPRATLAAVEGEPSAEKPIEHERQFLPDPSNLPPVFQETEPVRIEQGYARIKGVGEPLRLRRTTSPDGAETFEICVKTGKPPDRPEYESPVTPGMFEAFWPGTEGSRLTKGRITITPERLPLDDPYRQIDLDLFPLPDGGAAYKLEVEFDSAEQRAAFRNPDWFGPEITGVSGYGSRSIAENGFPGGAEEPDDAEPDPEPPPEIAEPRSAVGVVEGLTLAAELIDWHIQAESTAGPEPMVVAVAGGSASGKTSRVAAALAERYTEDCVVVSLDDYCRGDSWLAEAGAGRPDLSWDHPEYVDLSRLAADLAALRGGESVRKPTFDFSTGEPGPDETVAPRAVIVVEGVFALRPELERATDLGIYVDVSRHGQLWRRLPRDVARTSRSPEEIVRYICGTLWREQERFVAPTAGRADILIENDYDPTEEARRLTVPECQFKMEGRINETAAIAAGLQRLATVRQRDTYLVPDGLDLHDQLVRIREENGTYTLTYKGPEQGREDSERPQIGVVIDAEVARLLTGYYRPEAVIDKERRIFQHGSVILAEDTLIEPDLHRGRTFVEVRYGSGWGKPARRIAKELGLPYGSKERRPYRELLRTAQPV